MVALARVLPLCALLLVLPSMMPSGLAFAQGRPEFVSPADSQKLARDGSYQFEVKRIANAQGYSWEVLQNGKVVEKKIFESPFGTGNQFGIHPMRWRSGQIVPGRPVEVRVRAKVKDKWTDPTSITISAVGQQPASAASDSPTWVKYGWLLLFLSLPALTYVIVKYSRRATAEHAKRVEEAGERTLRNVLAQLPAELANAMKQPLQRLCADILREEEAFQNRRLSPGKIEVLLGGLVSYWLLNRSQQLQIPNLLTRGEGGVASFPVPLYRLHADVACSIQNVDYAIQQQSSPDSALAYGYPFYNYPFKRVALTLYRNWAKENGFNPDKGEQPPKKGQAIYAEDLTDKISVEELIRRFLDGTPFVDFLRTKVNVSIPHRSRFEHTHIVAGTGHGKTQLLQYLILNDLPHVAAGTRSVIVIDSQGSDSQRGLIHNILSLESVGAMADRVVLIDPNEYIPALNLFDFGLDRLKGYKDQQKRKQVLNGAIELYKYIFGALLRADVTMRQDVIFSNLARLMMVVPGATIKTLRDFMRQPELTRPYIPKLEDNARDFFETEFFASKYNDTREQLLTRLWGILTETELASMFAAKRNTLDLFSAMNRGSLILISTNKPFLNQDASAIFGRFFIALIRQATRERELGNQDKLRDTFVYIDEAHEYFDESMGNLFEQARKFQVGMVIAHQHLGQFKNELRDTVTGNTTVKIAGGVSHDDARDFAKEMNCAREFIQSRRKHEEADPPYTEFACYVKDYAKHAIALKVPLLEMEGRPKMSPARRSSLIEANRARYGVTNERPPDGPGDDDSPLGDPELL
jgi:hypothetical protein